VSALHAHLLGRPIAIYSDVVVCDREHEHTIVTDGFTAYAWNEAADVEFTAVVREGHEIQGHCPVESRGEQCGSVVTWDLTDAVWTGDDGLVEILVQFGKPIEQGDDRG
jgi:hypothetical protein